MGKCGVISLSSTPLAPINHDFVYNALSALIDVSRRSQEINSDDRRLDIDRRRWLFEYCTVRVGSSRGSGHTQAIMRYIFDHEINATILVNYESEYLRLANDFQIYATSKNLFVNRPNRQIIVVKSKNPFTVRFDATYKIFSEAHRGAERPSVMFVDGASRINNLEEVELLAQTYASSDQTFVFVMMN